MSNKKTLEKVFCKYCQCWDNSNDLMTILYQKDEKSLASIESSGVCWLTPHPITKSDIDYCFQGCKKHE